MYGTDLLEASVSAWLQAVLLRCTLAMMVHASLVLTPCTSSGIGSRCLVLLWEGACVFEGPGVLLALGVWER